MTRVTVDQTDRQTERQGDREAEIQTHTFKIKQTKEAESNKSGPKQDLFLIPARRETLTRVTVHRVMLGILRPCKSTAKSLRPDITGMVDWALNINYLSIYLSI